MPAYPSGLAVQMVVQPSLDVYFYFQEGDRVYLGTTGTVQIELKDRQGECYSPPGDIMVSVFAVDDSNTIANNPTVMGVAAPETMETIPMCGRYVFDFDTSAFPVGTERLLVRASVPYGSTSVLWQRTVQLQDPNCLN